MKTTRSQSQCRWQFAHHSNQLNASRGGWTVLEVLISSGIMVVGLACVAALLPAAAQRMAQAVSEDRAGTVAANAYADIMARRSLGLLSATPPGVNSWPTALFLSMGTGSADLEKVALDANGETLSLVVNTNTLFSDEAWAIQDALDFDESAGSPVNTFNANGNRKTRANPMCWLATLVPDAGANNPVVAGDVAELSIAVFKKQPSATEIVAGSLAGGVLTIGGNAVDDDTRRQLAKGCGSILALGATPEWIRVNASWTDATGTHLICDQSYSGNVVLFANLVRVEKHRVVLD